MKPCLVPLASLLLGLAPAAAAAAAAAAEQALEGYIPEGATGGMAGCSYEGRSISARAVADVGGADVAVVRRARRPRAAPQYATNLHLWNIASWFAWHAPSLPFHTTAAHLVNMTAVQLAGHLNTTIPAADDGPNSLTSLMTIYEFYCYSLFFHAWVLYPVARDDAAWRPHPGVPAAALSKYMDVARLRPVMGVAYARPDNTANVAVARNPGTKRARYTEYRPGAPPLDRTDDVLASHIVAFFALDLDRSVAAGPDLLDRVRAMEAEAEAEAAWRK